MNTSANMDTSAATAGSKVIFVGNLTWTTTDEDLVTFLSQQGNVLKAEVQRYEDTKRSKGWGLVEFDESESAVRAVNALNGQELHGRPVHLRLERSTTYNVEDGSVRVFVGNLAWSVTEAELMSLFHPFEPHGCHIITNMYGRSRGFGIVKFSSETAAQAAIDQFNESMLHDRPLEVRFDRGNAGKPAVEDAEERKSIFVGNLGNFIATDDALALLFQSVGTVSSAKVQMAANGRSKGWGIVTFESAHEAQAAVESMNGHVLRGNQRLEVKLDRK